MLQIGFITMSGVRVWEKGIFFQLLANNTTDAAQKTKACDAHKKIADTTTTLPTEH